jgi:RNA ligase
MRYKFPRIEHLNDVLPAIEGREEFFVGEREWGKVVNYMVNLTDSFPPVHTAGGSAKMRAEQSRLKALRRECRGLLFYPDGRIMARRFQKFFNLNEREETLAENIDFTQPHVILEKLDGSMITPLIVEECGVEIVRFGTKMGLTDVSNAPEEFVRKNHFIKDFSAWLMKSGFTPIFEWCSRKQRIVIDYPQDRLVLTAVRNTVTGEYEPYSKLLEYNNVFGLDIVKAYAGTAENMEMLLEETRNLKGAEGWVIRFEDGHMLKVKAESYVSMHHAKDAIATEKNVIDLIVNDKIDDFKSLVMVEDREKIIKFEDDFWNGISETIVRYTTMWNEICSHKLDRKRFAIERMPQLKISDQYAANIIFGLFDGRDIRSMVVDIIRKSIGTQTKVDQVRYLWGNSKWEYQSVMDD